MKLEEAYAKTMQAIGGCNHNLHKSIITNSKHNIFELHADKCTGTFIWHILLDYTLELDAEVHHDCVLITLQWLNQQS